MTSVGGARSLSAFAKKAIRFIFKYSVCVMFQIRLNNDISWWC